MDDAPIRTRSGSEQRQRSHLVQVRCTAEEHAHFQAAAERTGMSVGAYLRHQGIGTAGPRAVRRPPVERLALAQLLGQIGKLGGNINQIAKALNGNGQDARDIAEAAASVNEMSRAVLAVMRGKRP